MHNILGSTISLVSFVAVDLCQVPGRVREASARGCCKKNNFLLKVRLLAVPHLKLLLKRILRSRVREEVVVMAVVPQLSEGDINNSLFVCIYRLLPSEI